MTDIKEAQGLEVVGYLLAKGRALSIWPANKDTDEPLCRLSDATAVIDQLRERVAELEAKWRTEHDTANAHIMAHDAVRAELAALKSAPVVVPAEAELIAFAVEEQFLLFCDEDEFVQIAAAVLHKFARLNGGKP